MSTNKRSHERDPFSFSQASWIGFLAKILLCCWFHYFSVLSRFSKPCWKLPGESRLSSSSVACSASGFWWGEWITHRLIRPPSWIGKKVESWGEVKSLPSQWEGERKTGEGGGDILAPILPVCSESKMAAKHSKDENHQNRLHCLLRPAP